MFLVVNNLENAKRFYFIFQECHICKKAFALPGNLRAHIKKTHGVLM